ncbi:hypothetical protein [Spirosoma validum]|uniref:Uncharacterized protein n=1 Tax=Spirosoma validum TaxID=2771355 RepID=A0A927GHA8_9BACT|nr:hypothetical protein [Spirosoma validum]MBD2757837.1 hypothetical protein [Spirosoma validum]
MEAIGVKEVAKQGADFLKNLYEDASDMLVEEVEMDDQQQYWFITFSYLYKKKRDERISTPLNATLESLSTLYPSRERNYKTLKIDAKTGAVLSMKIRELQG